MTGIIVNKYRDILEAIKEGYYEVDLNGYFTFANEALGTILGISKDELIGKSFKKYLDNDTSRMIEENSNLVFKSSGKGSIVELNIIKSDKTKRYVEASVDLLYDSNGYKIGFKGTLRDRTEKVLVHDDIEAGEIRYKRLYDNSLVGMITIDITTSKIVESNSFCFKMFGFNKKEEFIGNVHFNDLCFEPGDIKGLFKKSKGEIEVFDKELQFRRKDGSLFWAEIRASIYPEELKIDCIIIDISKRKIAEETVLDLTFYDRLTQLPNKEMFPTFIQTEIMRARKNSGSYLFAVMCIGIDHFKDINNVYGLKYGDQILLDVSRRLNDVVIKKEDKISRSDGDKFLVLFSNLKKADDAALLINNIRKVFQTPFKYNNQKIDLSSSIGVCLYPKDGDDSDSLIFNSEIAMYIAKEIGRNTYHLFDTELNSRILEQFKFERELRGAIVDSEFVPFFQPKFDRHGKINGMESLARWITKDNGIISPLKFIPIAEKNGLIMDIGYYILKRSCEQNKKWQDMGFDPISVAVNISPYQFKQPDLLDNIEKILGETGLESKWLELEITESGIIENEKDSIDKLASMRERGFSITIDDFGTGYSSLSKLQDYPIDTLKIDKSFIDNIVGNEKTAAIAKYIINLAHDLGFKVVAEGVETKEQLDFLVHHGCDAYQGFYFSKPLPPEIFERKMFLPH
ncbi:EAL domain-containing protein [Spirochaetota bacterium]